jgi:hypothetical protein
LSSRNPFRQIHCQSAKGNISTYIVADRIAGHAKFSRLADNFGVKGGFLFFLQEKTQSRMTSPPPPIYIAIF